MSLIMRLSLSFFAISTVLGLSLAAPALGQSSKILIQPDDGTYKTVNVSSSADCTALCQAEASVCRGSVTMQTLINGRPNTVMECRLNNGKGANALFPSVPPASLDMNIALADFNAYRAEHGLAPVILNTKLNEASRVHAADLGKAGIISHTGTDGSSHSDRVQRQGYYFMLAAENVASGQKSWEKVFEAWQKSPGHNKNLLLEEVTDFGIALVYEPDTTYQTYWAMLVATPMDAEMQDMMRYQSGTN